MGKVKKGQIRKRKMSKKAISKMKSEAGKKGQQRKKEIALAQSKETVKKFGEKKQKEEGKKGKKREKREESKQQQQARPKRRKKNEEEISLGDALKWVIESPEWKSFFKEEEDRLIEDFFGENAIVIPGGVRKSQVVLREYLNSLLELHPDWLERVLVSLGEEKMLGMMKNMATKLEKSGKSQKEKEAEEEEKGWKRELRNCLVCCNSHRNNGIKKSGQFFERCSC